MNLHSFFITEELNYYQKTMMILLNQICLVPTKMVALLLQPISSLKSWHLHHKVIYSFETLQLCHLFRYFPQFQRHFCYFCLQLYFKKIIMKFVSFSTKYFHKHLLLKSKSFSWLLSNYDCPFFNCLSESCLLNKQFGDQSSTLYVFLRLNNQKKKIYLFRHNSFQIIFLTLVKVIEF